MLKKIVIIMVLLPHLFINTYAKDTSKSSIVMDMNTKRVLYEKNSNEKRLIASTTKIMTAILTIENSNINDKVEVGNEILSMYGTNIYLEIGEKIKIKDLLYGLLLRSGNDASVVLAKYIGGTEENFVKMMNNKAEELGMTNTVFSNPHGLDDYTKNYSTAYDMALLSSYANQNKTYRIISGTQKYTTQTDNKSYLWYNRNKLLSTYEYCTGGKNGYTPDAGRTLVTTAKKDKLSLTIVTLNDPNEYNTHQNLYNQIYKKYKMYKIIDKNNFKISKELYSGKIKLSNSFYYPLTNKEKQNIKTEITILEQTKATSQIGYVKIKLGENVIGIVDIYKNEEKKEDISIFNKIKNYLFDIRKKLKLGLQNNLKPGPFVPIPLEINNSVFITL